MQLTEHDLTCLQIARRKIDEAEAWTRIGLATDGEYEVDPTDPGARSWSALGALQWAYEYNSDRVMLLEDTCSDASFFLARRALRKAVENCSTHEQVLAAWDHLLESIDVLPPVRSALAAQWV